MEYRRNSRLRYLKMRKKKGDCQITIAKTICWSYRPPEADGTRSCRPRLRHPGQSRRPNLKAVHDSGGHSYGLHWNVRSDTSRRTTVALFSGPKPDTVPAGNPQWRPMSADSHFAGVRIELHGKQSMTRFSRILSVMFNLRRFQWHHHERLRQTLAGFHFLACCLCCQNRRSPARKSSDRQFGDPFRRQPINGTSSDEQSCRVSADVANMQYLSQGR